MLSLADDTPEIKQVARLGRGTAYTLAWRPDGEVLAVGSATGVWFFDEDFNELGRLAEDMPVVMLEWSPEGERLITFNNAYNTQNCHLIVWNVSPDVQSSSQDKSFDNCAVSVDWSSDGNLIAIGFGVPLSGDTAIHIISSKDYEIIKEFSGLGASAIFSPDSKTLAISYDLVSFAFYMMDVVTWQEQQIQVDGLEFVFTSSWSTDSRYLSIGCNSIEEQWDFWGDCIWDVESKEILNAEPLSRFVWHPTKNWFISYGNSAWGGSDQTSWLNLHKELNENKAFEKSHVDTIRRINWHPSGHHFTALTQEQKIVEFSSLTGEVLDAHSLFGTSNSNITWIPQSNSLLTYNENLMDENSTIRVWSLESNNYREPLATHIIDDVDEIQWVDDSQEFIVHSYGGMGYYWLNLWDATTFEHIKIINEHFDQENAIPYITYSSDISKVVYYAPDYHANIKIRNSVYDRANEVEIQVNVDRIHQIEWSPDDSMIATAGNISDSHYVIDIWHTTTGEKISSIQRSWMKHFSRFVWSPDSTKIIMIGERTTGGDAVSRTVTVYDVGKDYDQYTTDFNWYDDTNYRIANVMNASWSPDSLLVAVSFKEAVKILDVTNGGIMIEIPVQSINSLDWHENGNYLAGGASDGTIYVWDVSALMEQ